MPSTRKSARSRSASSALLLVPLSLQKLALLMLSHLLPTLLDHATQLDSPRFLRRAVPARGKRSDPLAAVFYKLWIAVSSADRGRGLPGAVVESPVRCRGAIAGDQAEQTSASSPEQTIERVPPRENGYHRSPTLSELIEQPDDRLALGVDHSTATQTAKRLPATPDFEVELGEIQIGADIIEGALHCLLADSPSLVESLPGAQHRESHSGLDTRMFGVQGRSLTQQGERGVGTTGLELLPGLLEQVPRPSRGLDPMRRGRSIFVLRIRNRRDHDLSTPHLRDPRGELGLPVAPESRPSAGPGSHRSPKRAANLSVR